MTLVSYAVEGPVATITMDDGKVNALSPAMLAEIGEALDAAKSTANLGAVVVAGRPGIFSAGFSLPVLQGGGPEALGMLMGGFELAERLLSFPLPVVAACPGHAIAMGSFLLLSTDYRVGAGGTFKITANEVAIGMTMPFTAVEICRQRLVPAHFHRAVALAEVYDPEGAVVAGFLDRVVPAEEVVAAAEGHAAALAKLDLRAHMATKQRSRAAALSALREAIEADRAALTPPAG